MIFYPKSLKLIVHILPQKYPAHTNRILTSVRSAVRRGAVSDNHMGTERSDYQIRLERRGRRTNNPPLLDPPSTSELGPETKTRSGLAEMLSSVSAIIGSGAPYAGENTGSFSDFLTSAMEKNRAELDAKLQSGISARAMSLFCYHGQYKNQCKTCSAPKISALPYNIYASIDP